MSWQHSTLAAGRWNEFSLVEQLAHIGSEVSRTIGWTRRGNKERADQAFERSLELFDLTLGCARNAERIREVCRAREFWADFYTGANIYNFTAEFWEKYFLQFGVAARKNS